MASLGDQDLKDLNPAAGMNSSNKDNSSPQQVPEPVASVKNTSPAKPNTKPVTNTNAGVQQDTTSSQQSETSQAPTPAQPMSTTNQENMETSTNTKPMSTSTPSQTMNVDQQTSTKQEKSSSSPTEHEYAGVMRRYAAASIDSLIVSFFTSLIAFPLGIMSAVTGTDSGGSNMLISGALWLFQMAIYVAYYVYFIGSKAQTPGKMFLKVKVLKEDDSSMPSYTTAFLREIVGKFVSGVALGLGYLWVLFDSKKQGWHDKIAGTVVVEDGELGTGRKILIALFIIIPILAILGFIAAIFLIGINPAGQLDSLQQNNMLMEEQQMQMEEIQREMETFEDTGGNTVPEYNFNEN